MALDQAYAHFDQSAAETLDWFYGEIAGLRTGRVTAGAVADLPVEHYGSRTPLQGVASISTLDARTLQVSPWDATAIPAIEKALSAAQLGAQPIVDGKVIRLAFPSLTEEVREATVKKLHQKAEEARIRLRQARDEAVSQVTEEKRRGDLTEDDFYDGREELNKRINDVNRKIEEAAGKKEAEIRTV